MQVFVLAVPALALLVLVVVTNLHSNETFVLVSEASSHVYDGLYTISDQPVLRRKEKQPYIPALVPSLPSPSKPSKQKIAREKLTPKQRAIALVDGTIESVRHATRHAVAGAGALAQVHGTGRDTLGSLASPGQFDKENTLGALFSLSHRLQRSRRQQGQLKGVGESSNPEIGATERKNALGVLFAVHPPKHANGHLSSDGLTWISRGGPEAFDENGARMRQHPRRPTNHQPAVGEQQQHRTQSAYDELRREERALVRRELRAEEAAEAAREASEAHGSHLRTGSLSLRHILKGVPGLPHAFTTMYDTCGFGPCTLQT